MSLLRDDHLVLLTRKDRVHAIRTEHTGAAIGGVGLSGLSSVVVTDCGLAHLFGELGQSVFDGF